MQDRFSNNSFLTTSDIIKSFAVVGTTYIMRFITATTSIVAIAGTMLLFLLFLSIQYEYGYVIEKEDDEASVYCKSAPNKHRGRFTLNQTNNNDDKERLFICTGSHLLYQAMGAALCSLLACAPFLAGLLSALPLKSKLVSTVLGPWFVDTTAKHTSTMTTSIVLGPLPPGGKTSHGM